ncbi:MAG TPA: penicillin acylase family protein [Planctomycetota bacterium]|nr:penicillin acylase family protein [Planctomycetota bacterium]
MHRVLTLGSALLFVACQSGPTSSSDLATWQGRASRVTITRDNWGVAHVRGASDADAVFGMIYAQAEDDFHRIEVNYLTALGRLAEAQGEEAIWSDLRMRLFIEPEALQAMYATSPEWLRELMDAWADGLNYYLHENPDTRPLVLTHFEPWMALAFSEGSIGGDIERVSLRELEKFYGGTSKLAAMPREPREPTGSNGFAIAPSRSASGKALLLINPHTSFFFREELQMTSDSGLDAYGAVTWGQFFVYQGFNATAGWMHTSSNNDSIDEFAVAVTKADSGWTYSHGSATRPVHTRKVRISYRTPQGLASRDFTVHATHHGPVVRETGGKWIAVQLMQEPVKALTQSYLRTKARNLAEFRATMELHTNSSNNTVFADAEGNIAYFHANFIPRRDPRFDWSNPVDGNDPATDWQGVHSVDESPNVFNPRTGWIQNTNNWPWSAAGADSPRQSDYAKYFEHGEGENARGLHAIEVLSRESHFDLDKLVAAAFDPHLTTFDVLIPELVRRWEALPDGDERKAKLAEPVALLRAWDRCWGVGSEATTLAVFWGEDLWRHARAEPGTEGSSFAQRMATLAPPAQWLASLERAVAQLTRDFGSWKVHWGEVNRFQRLTGAIEQQFADDGASTPVGFTSSRWGSLAAFQVRPRQGLKRLYGTSGNSFVAVVEFGDPVRARAVTAGGLDSVPGSPHFNDQAERYARGELRPVYFAPDELRGHVERVYHPGEWIRR